MTSFNKHASFAHRFYRPLQELLLNAQHTRRCPELSDMQWLRMGAQRVLEQHRSGRGFLQQWASDEHSADSSISVSHFFEALKSKRRLALLTELNEQLCRQMPEHAQAQFSDIPELNKVDVYAGDGHYHSASVHDTPVCDKRRAVGHFYSLNLRSCAMSHLTNADLQSGRKKAEHDMHALKRLSKEHLRQGAVKGRQVLYVWDCAGIDFQQWYKWKSQAGIYFLSRLKELVKLTFYGENDFDRNDPLNAGIIADQLVSPATGPVPIRYIAYECPRSGRKYEFLTNHRTIRPGVIAWLYMRRWDVEKTYDSFKNKFCEQKAWAKTDTAKSMQALFLCIAHNLATILGSHIEETTDIQNTKEIQRCQKRNSQFTSKTTTGVSISPLYLRAHKRSQLTLKFIRWLRHQLNINDSLSNAIKALRRVYALF